MLQSAISTSCDGTLNKLILLYPRGQQCDYFIEPLHHLGGNPGDCMWSLCRNHRDDRLVWPLSLNWLARKRSQKGENECKSGAWRYVSSWFPMFLVRLLMVPSGLCFGGDTMLWASRRTPFLVDTIRMHCSRNQLNNPFIEPVSIECGSIELF